MNDSLMFFALMAVVLLGGFAVVNAQLAHAKSKLKLVPVKIRARRSEGSPLS